GPAGQGRALRDGGAVRAARQARAGGATLRAHPGAGHRLQGRRAADRTTEGLLRSEASDMAHSKQALKRIRQNEKNRLRNKAKMSAIRTGMKALLAAVQAGDKAKAQLVAVKTCKTIDKAAQANVIHQNNAARHKGQVMRAVAAMK